MKRLPHIGTPPLHLLPLTLIMLLIAYPHASARNRPAIIIVSSSQLKAYHLVIQGFQKLINQQIPEAEVETFFLGPDLPKNRVTLEKIKSKTPTLLFTLGTKATQEIQAIHPERPQVVTMVLKDSILKQSTQATGVVLNFPPKIHLSWLQRLLPDANRVYLLYNPQENRTLFAEMKQAADGYQLELHGIPLESVSQLPAALKSVGRQADILLGLPDQTVYSSKTAKAILLSTFRNRIPFAGLSRYWVKAGALYALDWDYQDLGRQCGEMASRILTGTPVADIPPVPPRTVRYVINMKTADHLRLNIAPSLIQDATEVFR